MPGTNRFFVPRCPLLVRIADVPVLPVPIDRSIGVMIDRSVPDVFAGLWPKTAPSTPDTHSGRRQANRVYRTGPNG
ncbi:unnamed protein product [Soboliphyme baturini]|uniref:Transposase n=1 Tax=Soboliphyme baturini TaxID=241478 RepID=A0A183IXW5_9BILA|nr:unnamed protein product [Soboliphyme baturini]